MAAPYNPPKRGEEFQIDIGLADMSNNGRFKASPTLAAGDFKVSKDGGALANLATLPTNTPAASKMVRVALSATEMTADVVTVICSDPDGEWADYIFSIPTVT